MVNCEDSNEDSIVITFFFFSSRRRHTRWNCDWSSDVCSSDLAHDAENIHTGKIDSAVVFPQGGGDRKSTRLNSSHSSISYAVFCLKKKIEYLDQAFLKIFLSLSSRVHQVLFFLAVLLLSPFGC